MESHCRRSADIRRTWRDLLLVDESPGRETTRQHARRERHGIGTLARIRDWDMPQLGVLNVVALGERRFRVLEHRAERDGLLRARVELLDDDRDADVPAECAICAKILRRIADQQPALFAEPHRLESASWVSARLAELLPLPLETKQELLETRDARARIERLNAMIRPEPEG